MDLKSIINNEATDSSPHKHAPTPVTPSHAGPPLYQPYRDLGTHAHPQASHRHLSQDFGAVPYSSPTTYHPRPAPPLQLQQPSPGDLRSPAASSHHSAQSPYRHTPTSSLSGHQFPFPQNPPPQSPVNHQNSLQQRDSYSHPANAPPHHQNHNSYSKSSSVPQTPPVGLQGNPYPPYPAQHQRSPSSLSAPTSAQSQHQSYGQYIHDSSVSAGNPQQAPPHHHPSQPGTPLGPPISIPRQSSGVYPQPQSPYSQRAPSIGAFATQYPNIQTPPAPQIPRLPSTPNAFESQRFSSSELNRRSQRERSESERERSLSVSPKTRLPSQTRISIPADQPSEMERSGRIKREREDSVPIHSISMNGRQSMESNIVAAATPSPVQPARKRVRYSEPPIWAQSWRKLRGKQPNLFVAAKGPSPPQTNGKAIPKPPPTSFDPQSVSRGQSMPPRSAAPLPMAGNNGLLGPWEPSISGTRPLDESCIMVADWLFQNVVNRADINELTSSGVQIEIEAKFGELVDSDTRQRLQIPALSECILIPGSQGLVGGRTLRWNFSSSMTENQHKTMNTFLNRETQLSQVAPRVAIQYKHRRERDSFYEIPRDMIKNLPPIIQAHINPRHTVKVRVSHDAKTNEQLAKIIKARMADLDIYMPRQAMDCRISINFEANYDGDVEDLQRAPSRNKDRLSYEHSHYQFDLTQVTMGDKKEHELELELSAKALKEQGERARADPPVANMYRELVQGFVDNIRVVARAIPQA